MEVSSLRGEVALLESESFEVLDVAPDDLMGGSTTSTATSCLCSTTSCCSCSTSGCCSCSSSSCGSTSSCV